MATAYPLAGGANAGETLSWLSDDKYVYSTNNNVPAGNPLTNGTQWVLVTHLHAYVAGRGATRTVRLGLQGAWTGWFNVGASSRAQSTGWIGYGAVHGPGAHNFHIDQSAGGGMFFGRSVNGTGATGVEGGSGSGWSGSLSGQMLVIGSPSQVPWVAANRNSNGTITVSWGAPGDNGGDAIHTFYIASATNASFTQNGMQTNVPSSSYSYTFSGLAPGATYYFKVSSGNALANAAGYGAAWSGVASAMSSAVPSTPTALVASKTADASTTVNLSWTAPADNGSAISSYDIQWATSSDFTTGLNSKTSTTASTTIPVTLATQYYVRVRANNTVGASPWSAVTTFPFAPSAPSSVGVASVNSTTLTASWNAPASTGGDPITNYELQWSTSPTFSPGNSSNGNNRSRTVSSLTALTLYYFRVRATNGIGTSPWSATASFTTAQTEPPPEPPAVTRGGRLKVNGTFIEPKVRVRDNNGVWKNPISKIRRSNTWVDPV